MIPAGAVLRRYTILVQLGSDRTATQSGSPETEDLLHNLEFLLASRAAEDHGLMRTNTDWSIWQTTMDFAGCPPRYTEFDPRSSVIRPRSFAGRFREGDAHTHPATPRISNIQYSSFDIHHSIFITNVPLLLQVEHDLPSFLFRRDIRRTDDHVGVIGFLIWI